jgi:hypothetical protein
VTTVHVNIVADESTAHQNGLRMLDLFAAYADGGDGPAANTLFTELPGVVAQADVPNASAYAQNRQVQPQQAQNGQGVQVYVSRQRKPRRQ